jgi:hypothetical protein
MTAAWAKVAVRTAPMTVDDANVMQVMVVSPLRSCVILPQNTANAVPGRGHYCAARRHQQDSALKFSYHNFKMQMSCRPRLLFSPSGLGGRDIPFVSCAVVPLPLLSALGRALRGLRTPRRPPAIRDARLVSPSGRVPVLTSEYPIMAPAKPSSAIPRNQTTVRFSTFWSPVSVPLPGSRGRRPPPLPVEEEDCFGVPLAIVLMP